MRTILDAFNAAIELYQQRKYPEAEAVFDRLISEDEDFWPAYFALGSLFAELGMNGKAIALLKRTLDFQPEHHEAMSNLAGVYRRLEKKEQAFEWNRKALAIKPSAETLSNMAGAYVNEGNPEPALEWAEKALQLAPGMPQAGNHKALALLELGRFEEGWKAYDSRLELPQFHKRPFECPMWDGKPVKKLAIHGEQGLGDEILFLTCLAQLKDRAEEIEVEVAPRLVKLIQHSFPDVQVYAEHDDRAFDPDAYIPMGSLPRLCWPVKPNVYLKPTLEIERNGEEPRIGLSWKGGAALTHAKLRNTSVDQWKTLTDLGEVISLQYGDRAHEAAELGIWHDTEAIADLDHLAALIKSCDLVITVCNTTVHMAGALGVPCICLVPSKPAWRYGLTGEMVWYDSVKLVRQEKNEPWISVLARAKQKAKEICADYRPVSRIEQATA